MPFQTASKLFFRCSPARLSAWKISTKTGCLSSCAVVSRNEKIYRPWSKNASYSFGFNQAYTTNRNTSGRSTIDLSCYHNSNYSKQTYLNLTTNTKETEDDFKVIYKLPCIKHFRFISRIKILHVGIVTSLTWPVCYWFSQGTISTPVFLAALTAASATTVGLVVLSYFFRRVVGEFAVDPSRGTVKISTLSFWGNRRNTVFRLEDLTPLSDSGLDPKRIFQRLEISRMTDVFLISLQHGKICNEKMFFDVVGFPLDSVVSKTDI